MHILLAALFGTIGLECPWIPSRKTSQKPTRDANAAPAILAEDWRAVMSRGEEATTQTIG